MFKFIQDHKLKAIVSSLLILLPMLTGIIMWDQLPNTMTTHFGGDAVADGTSPKAFAIFGMPLIILALHWVAILITCFDKNNRNQNRKAIGLVFWILPVVSIIIEAITMGLAMGRDINFEFIIMIPIALLFISFGNYMPKITQNSTFGIKLPWTLASEENWNKTHRLGGKIWMISGFAVLIGMLLPAEAMISVFFAALLTATLVPTVYSYIMFNRQKASDEPINTKVNYSGKTIKISGAFTIIILIAVGILMFTGNINVHFEDDGFNIEASYYDDIYVEYDAIDSCELRDDVDTGVRSNGCGSPQLSMGTFENEEFGLYTRYAYTGEDTCIVLTSDDEVLVLSGKDIAATKALYEDLVERIK